MVKIVRTVVLFTYCGLILQVLKFLFFDNVKEITELNYFLRTPGTYKKLMGELKKIKNNLTALQIQFRSATRLPTDYKYILKWTKGFSHLDSPNFRRGQKVFLDHNCTHQNCYVTTDKGLLVDIRHFNAFIFDVENTWDSHPPIISPHQLLIFSASEPAFHFPVCHTEFDNYFHLTWTYKLNSDIIGSYITILDKEENIVGPKINMTWVSPMIETSNDVKLKLVQKSKAVAWFVSNCNAPGRKVVAKDLSIALEKFKLNIDIYGGCGNLTCPRDRMEECLLLLQNKYYFYLAFENSLCEDYVTEKILYPLLHFTVPIVFGGADYTRFLPPGSYIDAGKLSADNVVSLMLEAMDNQTAYFEYFRWHNHYIYKATPQGNDFCRLCEILNEPSRNFNLIKDMRKWWNPEYKTHCNNIVQVTENIDFLK